MLPSALFLALALTVSLAQAQDYPSKPVKLIVPFAAGGGTDILARPYAQLLQVTVGQPVVVENRPGVGALLGTNAVAAATPDGYTMGLIGFSFLLGQFSPEKPDYDPIRDFTHLSLLGKAPMIIVSSPAMPVRSIKELIAYAKARPGQINYSRVGSVSTGTLATLSFQSMTGLELTPINYKGAAQSIAAVAGGEVQFTFTSLATTLPLIKAGKVIALGVTGATRSSVLPEVPTVAESGVSRFEEGSFYGLILPAKMPSAILARLNRETAQIVTRPEIRKAYNSQGIDPESSTPEAFSRFLSTELAKWSDIFRKYPPAAD